VSEQTSPISARAVPRPEVEPAPRRHRLGSTLGRYVARELRFPTLFTLIGVSLLALASQLLAFSDLVVNRGLGAIEVGSIALYQLVPAVGNALPFATLIGVIIALARLGRDRELLAMQGAGIAPARLGLPVLGFTALLTAAAFAVSLVLAPWAARGLEGALARMVREHPTASLRAGTINAFGDFRLEAREVSSSGHRLRGVLLWVPSMHETFFAREASVEPGPFGGPRVSLDEGILLTNTTPPGYLRFEHMQHVLPPAGPEIHGIDIGIESMSGAELRRMARHDPDAQRRRSASVEWHRRLALPFATFWLGALAVPLVLRRTTSTRATAALIGIGATVLYYALVQIGNGILRDPAVPVAEAVWMPDVVLLAVAVAAWVFGLRPASGATNARPRAAEPLTAKRHPLRTRRWPLDRYVLVLFAQTAAMCFSVLLVVFLLGDVVDNLQWFAKYQSTLGEVGRFYVARLPMLASRVVPMALLVAAALTMSLLIVRGELVGMWASGVSTWHVVRSILLLCFVVTFAYHGLHNELAPRANARASYLKQNEIKHRADGAQKSLWYRVGDKLYVMGSFDPLRGEASDVAIYELDRSWLPKSRTDAAFAHHVGRGIWELDEPHRVEVVDGRATASPSPPQFAKLGEDVPAEVDTSHLTLGDLARTIRDIERSGYDATEFRVDFHQKLASPLACLVLPALALLVATAGPPFWTPAQSLVLCALEAVVYLVLSGVSASLGYGRFLPPAVAGFGPVALMSGAAGVLALRRGVRG
jgi:LPS export ABC transporter permease LptG